MPQFTSTLNSHRSTPKVRDLVASISRVLVQVCAPQDLAHHEIVIALGDLSGAIHQWGEGEDYAVNNYSYNAFPMADRFPDPNCEMTETRYYPCDSRADLH